MTEAQRARLFAVYYRCHFGRAVALDLCERTARVNRLIALLTLGCVAGSLLTGTIAFFAADWLKPGWAALNVGSVLMAIWAAIMSYSEKEFDYHQLAASFQKLALEVENFNGFAVFSGSFAEGDIDVKATAFHDEYSAIMTRTRREYKLHSDRHADRIDLEVRQRIRANEFARAADATGDGVSSV